MKTSVNVELTKRCNARCITCPRKAIKKIGDMKLSVFRILLNRIWQDRGKISMVNLSGYGESILYKDFFKILKLIKEFNNKLEKQGEKPLRFAVVTNAHALDKKKLEAMDGVLDRLSISFATINPENYKKIHLGLNYNKVVENIKLARKILKKTRIVLHLTPTRFTMDDIPDTVKYWRARGIREIVLFPFTFNRAGKLKVRNTHLDIDQVRNLKLARKLRLKQLEEVFIPGIKDLFLVLTKKDICLTKLACLYIDFEGNWHNCINDISSACIIGNIKSMGITDALNKAGNYKICKECNMKNGINKGSLIKIFINSMLAMKE